MTRENPKMTMTLALNYGGRGEIVDAARKFAGDALRRGKVPDLATRRAYFAMKVAAALREAMWGMISELYLASPGVNYVAYAAEYVCRFDKILETYRKDFP